MSNLQCDLSTLLQETTPVDTLTYHPVERRYRNVQIILTTILYLLVAAAALFLLLLENPVWCCFTEAAILIATTFNLFILLKAWKYKGYALRQQDISWRSGVIFPSVTTIPYRRLQQVSVKQNPVSRLFHLYSVEAVNGAQAYASLTIHGLNQETASQINDFLLSRLRNEPD
ncbi:MAG: PH domain-containing protein [Muribaculaceae bacterium]|nr:PH domain-containing protein [Muribaculaceae bacterium]